MKKLILLVSILALQGCKDPFEDPYATNRCIQQEQYYKCINSVPKGPDITTFNDWAEVVSTCKDIADSFSHRLKINIPQECR